MNSINLIDFIVRSLGVGGVAWLLILMLRHASHRVRIAVVTASWAMLAVLVIDCVMPLPRIEVWKASSSTISGSGFHIGELLFALWLAGVTVVIGREAFGLVRLRQIVRGADLIEEASWIEELELGKRELGISTPIELRWSDRLGPCAAGWLRPVILLPRVASQWTREMRAQVLIHELAHFRGRDLWVLVAVRFIAAVHWFNPFVAMLRRSLEAEREQACDAFVVQLRGDAVAYARSLLDLAATPSNPKLVPVLTLLPRKRSQIENRIRALLRNDRSTSPRRRWLEGIFAGAAVILLVACSVTGPATSKSQQDSMTAEVELRLSANPFPGEE